MEQQLRKSYLDAMEITQWVVRRPPAPEMEKRPAQPLAPEPATAAKAEPPARPSTKPAADHDAPPAWLNEAPLLDEECQPGEASDAAEQLPPRSIVADLGWDALQQHISACKACELHCSRKQTVFGTGSPQADLLIIGEAPGADEDHLGEPFMGRAGKLLNAMLKAIGFERSQVYIANILKCRPPDNRDPHVDEVSHCRPYLMRQIELINPKVILAVGRVSAQNLLESTDTLGRLRGRTHHFGAGNIPLIATYHPTYLLRSPEQKAKSWQDLQQVLTLLQQ
ncbi:MAG: hypothetical protein L3J26_03905 [Candidatus Polarisedimenticolaceae bacterium]|nr:hypothetical protein [Candidatus Polarisedimenticolaceae bacterium]